MFPTLSEGTQAYRFDGFVVDIQTAELWHLGERIPLQELPFQLLVALLRHPGELVSREELRAWIWPPGIHVGYEGSLATAVKKLRQALGDNPREPRYIETLPGRGYRFLCPVEPLGGQHPLGSHLLEGATLHVPLESGTIIPFRGGPSFGSREAVSEGPGRFRGRWWVPGLAVAVAILGLSAWRIFRGAPGHGLRASRPSLVVLPAQVLGSQAQDGFLADAIPGTLSTLLGSVEGLDTRVSPTSLEVEKVGRDLASIAKAYAVERLVVSSVTQYRGALLLNIQLLDAGSRRVLWARQYSCTKETFNTTLAEAAGAIVQEVDPPGSHRIKAHVLQATSALELAVGEGKHFKNRYRFSGRGADFEFAKEALLRAHQLDPKQPGPLAQLADLFLWRGNAGLPAADEGLQDLRPEGAGPRSHLWPGLKCPQPGGCPGRLL